MGIHFSPIKLGNIYNSVGKCTISNTGECKIVPHFWMTIKIGIKSLENEHVTSAPIIPFLKVYSKEILST